MWQSLANRLSGSSWASRPPTERRFKKKHDCVQKRGTMGFISHLFFVTKTRPQKRGFHESQRSCVVPSLTSPRQIGCLAHHEQKVTRLTYGSQLSSDK